MSLRDDVETGLLDLIDPDLFGGSYIVGGNEIDCIWRSSQSIVPGEFAGQVVERYRLTCARDIYTAVVGQEIEVEGRIWTVIEDRGLESICDIIVERYLA